MAGNPPISIDDALSEVTRAEAKLAADQANVVNIQTAIDTATGPLAVAQASVKDDVVAFNTAIDIAVAALTAAKIPV